MTAHAAEAHPQWACGFCNEPGNREIELTLKIGDTEPLVYTRKITVTQGDKLELPGYQKPEYARKAEGARRLAASMGAQQSSSTASGPDSPGVMRGGVAYGELSPRSRTLLDRAADMHIDAAAGESKTPRNTGLLQRAALVPQNEQYKPLVKKDDECMCTCVVC